MDHCIFYVRNPAHSKPREHAEDEADHSETSPCSWCDHPKHSPLTRERAEASRMELQCGGSVDACPLTALQMVDVG